MQPDFQSRACAAVACMLLAALSACHPSPPSGAYEPLPSSFKFPAPEGELEGLIQCRNNAQLRRHAWQVFAAINEPAGQTDPLFPKRQPRRWETWFLRRDAFAAAPPTARVPFLLDLQVPGELRESTAEQPPSAPKSPPTKHVISNPSGADGVQGGPMRNNLFATGNNVLFNQAAYDRIRSGTQPLYLQNTLDRLCGSRAGDTACNTGAQEIDAFPRGAIAIKAFFVSAPLGQCTAIGSWDFERPYADDTISKMPPSEATQLRRVFVENGAGVCDSEKKSGHKVKPWSDVYWVPVPAADQKGRDAEIAAARLKGIQSDFPDAKAGDRLVLVGMHVATRELENWFWMTFWWHDRPGEGPFAADRPSELKGVWRNYLMNISYDMDDPREPDGTPHIAYNPYLEGAMLDGVVTNCMTCHRRASWPPQPQVDVLLSDDLCYQRLLGLTVVRGQAAAQATYMNVPFDRLLKTSFLWSIQICATQQPCDAQ